MGLLIKSTYFLIGFIVVMGQDDFGNENGRAEYQNIFKNIPTLFEYMLQTLEDKPEVLEKNDANVFRADEDHEDEVVRFQRSANDNGVENRNVEKRKITDETINDLSNSNKQANKDKYDEAIIYDDNTPNNDDIEDVRNDKRETVMKELKDTSETESITTRKAVKRTINNDSNSDVEEEASGNSVSTFDGSDGNDTKSSLTPEEVAQQALRVEEMLEHHKKSKK